MHSSHALLPELTLPSLLALCEARTQRFLMLLEGATLASLNCTAQLRTRVSKLPCIRLACRSIRRHSHCKTILQLQLQPDDHRHHSLRLLQ